MKAGFIIILKGRVIGEHRAGYNVYTPQHILKGAVNGKHSHDRSRRVSESRKEHHDSGLAQ